MLLSILFASITPFKRLKRLLSGLPILILCLIYVGCATYGSKVEEVQSNLTQGKYEDALKKLEKTKSNRSMLLYLMEKGTILHYAGKYEESNETFEQAELLAEDLYTKSISKEAGSLLTSDNILPYSGEKYERTLIHYYRAFNYIKLKQPDSALVECRKVTILLQKYADETEGKSTAYSDDAFMQYLAGVLFEWRGELNDALISYRKAEEAYEKYAKVYNTPPPQTLKCDILRLAKSMNFDEEYEQYKNKYGIKDDIPEANPDEGVLILIYENGFAPRKDATELVLPILKNDNLSGKTDMTSYSGRLRERSGKSYSETELEYLLRVSIPRYVSNRPRASYIRLKTDGIDVKSDMMEDVEAIAVKNFDERMTLIFLKTTIRGITKYLAYKTAKDKKGEGAGLLVNVFNIITESADTRSWLSLPNNFQMIKTSLSPGKHCLQLNFYNDKGNLLKSTRIDDVEIKSGDFTFLNYRTYQ